MATVNDIGVPGQPLAVPPLTHWQAAVRDAILAHDAALSQASVWAPTAPWQDSGAGYDGLLVTRAGLLVCVQALLKPSSDTAVSAGGSYQLGTVPSGFRPSTAVQGSSWYRLSSAGGTINPYRLSVTTSGVVTMFATVSGTITAASGLVSVNITYRGA